MTRASRLFHRQTWNIGVVDAPIHAFLDPAFRPRIRFLDLPLDDRHFADPFAVVDGERVTILCEVFDERTWHGAIAAIALDDAGRASAPVTVLGDDQHMSYPSAVQDGDRVYCVPERRRAREVALYVADEFPARWTRVATLLDGVDAADATVFRHHGRWWMTYTDSALGLYDNLCLASADALAGPWRRHPGNPVKRDPASSRPGGTPFRHEGALYRPAQDRARGRVVINRVITLGPGAFAEEPVGVVEPDRASAFPDDLHTLSAAGRFTLVDSRRATLAVPRVGAALGMLQRSRERRQLRRQGALR